MLLLQACQVDNETQIYNLQSDAICPIFSRPNNITIQKPNILLLMSTVVGGSSVRGFYTRAIADYIGQSDGVTDIQGVHLAAVEQMRMHEDYDKCKQVPEFRSTLMKSLVLPSVEKGFF